MPSFLLILFSLLSFAIHDPEIFKQLSKLEGTWKMETPRGPLYEEWKNPCGDLMNGRSYKLKGNDTVLLEEIAIKIVAHDIYYIPTVQDQNNRQPVFFKLVSSSSGSFVFENKEHDFPQRIIYRFIHADSVVARIEGIKNGIERHSNFYYGRVK